MICEGIVRGIDRKEINFLLAIQGPLDQATPQIIRMAYALDSQATELLYMKESYFTLTKL